MQAQFDQRIIEPNSTLGAAILYMQKRWSQLTLFLRVPGAPLDNNISERALKKVILHRKNALFYRTLAGAHVGDVFMSLIHTAELNHVAPFRISGRPPAACRRARPQTRPIYRTLAGAHVGDVFMSLIHTAELNHVAPFRISGRPPAACRRARRETRRMD